MITCEQLQGHWIRDYIKGPDFADHSTRVHWMQCGSAYADVRIPADRPDIHSFTCLADLSAQALSGLVKAEGFAGHITLNGAQCTWHRRINWHGVPEIADIGHIAFDTSGRMIETGVVAEYEELWDHENPTFKQAVALSGQDYTGMLMIIGSRCVLAIDIAARPSTAPVTQQLENGIIPPQTAMLFDRIYALGTFENDQVVAELATQPKSEHAVLLTLTNDQAIWHRTDYYGSKTDIFLNPEVLA